MLKRTALLLVALLAFAGPAVAIEETLQITATGATSDQVSGTIVRPPTVDGLILLVKVTGGVALLLDVDLEVYSPTAGAWLAWSGSCPSVGGITGVSVTQCFFGPEGTSGGGHYFVSDVLVMLPTEFRILVEHGNATAATYTVHSQWVRK